MDLDKSFEDFRSLTIGASQHDHFIVNAGKVYCIRESCEGCSLQEGCDFEEEEIENSIIPHPRRGIGYEPDPFLILGFKLKTEEERFTLEDVPQELWENPYANLAMFPYNPHFLLGEPGAKFRVLKGQIRYYGSKAEFENSEYGKYFEVLDVYEPMHYITSLDFSAIEPRITTILSREEHWLRVFEGVSKPIVHEIEVSE